jgi:DNA-binding transcriptional regulator YdaS (Cro superfamily)
MKFDDWLDAERGRLTKLAEHFGVSPSAVSQWRVNGVPVDNIMAVHEFTDRQVTLQDLIVRPSARNDAASGSTQEQAA